MRWIFLTLVLLNALFAALEVFEGMGGNKKAENYRVLEGRGRLLLLGELDPLFSRAGPEGVGMLCLLLGPIDSPLSAKKLLRELNSEGLDTKIITQPIIKAPNYWVHLEPYENRKAAITKLKELKSAKVDSYLITQGELTNGISLGMFENIDSARRMLKKRQTQGYDVKIKELGKQAFEYWVFVEGQGVAELDKIITKNMEELKMSFGKREISCKSVASENNLP
ncbi:SPOR domain-containing protein [Alkalimarinus alittae]|uniref:SPOR domain-containing protein n=1 Tax=Alkalimarinus alittae TaxID=2961619 RepID=A0ABY6N160_9ALTE|nr:SPOR domain-containing protein [Alkalimarinus alittae]UZE95846.1 SPOR domain-containing protein [Alkalimarinus alittae]